MGFSSVYTCQQCGYQSGKWFGRCPSCNAWGSLVEDVIESSSRKSGNRNRKNSLGIKPKPLDSASIKRKQRVEIGIEELDRVLGGGVVAGQAVLIAGEPGIGKSTLLTQIADKVSFKDTVLYVSGEESVGQISIRAERLGIKSKNILVVEETDIDAVIDYALGSKPSYLIIDSIQTTFTSDLSGMAGSVGQVRECTFRLVKYAKSNNVPVFIVGHVTKEGTVAGPSVLMHIVDTVLWFEGDRTLTLRMIRAVKNRFGSTDEVGVFSMGDKGLIGESPEKLFLTNTKQTPGSAIASTLQGTRPILVEVQSLVSPSKSAFPKRIAQGIDSKRFELLLAVIIRRLNLPLYNFDAYINISGGITVKEPAIDLAVCMAVLSSYFDKPLPKGSVCIGEVGLLGDIRKVSSQEKRIKDAKKLGYKITISENEIKYLNQAVNGYFKK